MQRIGRVIEIESRNGKRAPVSGPDHPVHKELRGKVAYCNFLTARRTNFRLLPLPTRLTSNTRWPSRKTFVIEGKSLSSTREQILSSQGFHHAYECARAPSFHPKAIGLEYQSVLETTPSLEYGESGLPLRCWSRPLVAKDPSRTPVPGFFLLLQSARTRRSRTGKASTADPNALETRGSCPTTVWYLFYRLRQSKRCLEEANLHFENSFAANLNTPRFIPRPSRKKHSPKSAKRSRPRKNTYLKAKWQAPVGVHTMLRWMN